MPDYSKEYWEKCWKSEKVSELKHYLALYQHRENEIVELFRANGVKKVCDAAWKRRMKPNSMWCWRTEAFGMSAMIHGAG